MKYCFYEDMRLLLFFFFSWRQLSILDGSLKLSLLIGWSVIEFVTVFLYILVFFCVVLRGLVYLSCISQVLHLL